MTDDCKHAKPIGVETQRKGVMRSKKISYYVVLCAKDDKYATEDDCKECRERRQHG